MEHGTVEIRDTNAWGGLLVVATDTFGTTTHHWFDLDGSQAIHAQEVIYYGPGRHNVPDEKMMLPDRVREAVQAEGYEIVENS